MDILDQRGWIGGMLQHLVAKDQSEMAIREWGQSAGNPKDAGPRLGGDRGLPISRGLYEGVDAPNIEAMRQAIRDRTARTASVIENRAADARGMLDKIAVVEGNSRCGCEAQCPSPWFPAARCPAL